MWASRQQPGDRHTVNEGNASLQQHSSSCSASKIAGSASFVDLFAGSRDRAGPFGPILVSQ